jgi:hypothetical protein
MWKWLASNFRYYIGLRPEELREHENQVGAVGLKGRIWTRGAHCRNKKRQVISERGVVTPRAATR